MAGIRIRYGILLSGAALLIGVSYWHVLGRSGDMPGPSVIVAGKTYSIEIADTDAKRTLGLGERDGLCASCAMLFTFDRPGKHAFWMKGMRFPLDIVWLDSYGAAIRIERRIPADSPLVYTPDTEDTMVLELNAGQADGLSLGDRVEIATH